MLVSTVLQSRIFCFVVAVLVDAVRKWLYILERYFVKNIRNPLDN